MVSANDFITKLEEKARQQELASVPNVTEENLANRNRLLTASRFEAESIRKSQPSYSSARKLFNNETSRDIISDERDKNALSLRQAADKVDPVKLKEDLDGVFGGDNFFTKALIGKGIRDEDLGKHRSIGDELGARGLLGFFTGELLRSTPESEANLYEVFLDTGSTPEEAFKKARARVAGDDAGLNAEEVKAINSYEAWDTAFKFLDAGFLALDVATLGIAGVVRPILKKTAREGVSLFIKEAGTMTNRNDLRKLVAETYPELKGSQELEKMLDIVEEYPTDFSMFKARQDFQKTDTFNQLAKTVNPTPVDVATEAQRVIYQNGVPVIRKTVPDTLIARRTATAEAIRGNSEALRLSNADILADEIRAGSLALKTTADDSIPVWRIAPRGRRIKTGEEVSLVESFAKSVSEGGKIEKIEVPVADLIRLPDGTFTFAPERLVKNAPTLKFPKNLSKTVVDGAKAIEAKKAAKALADKEAAAKAKVKAAKEAQKKLDEPVEKAKANIKKLKEKPAVIRVQAQKKIIKEQSRTAKEVVTVKAASAKKVATIDKELRKAEQQASLDHIKRMAKAKTKLQEAKEKIRYQNQLAKLTTKAKADKAALKVSEDEAVDAAKGKGKRMIDSLKTTRTADLKKANKELKGTRGETAAIIKAATVTEKVVDTVAPSGKSTPAKKTKGKQSGDSFEPVGEGPVKESALYKSTQNTIREQRKDLGDSINSNEFEFYRQAINTDQIAKATAYVNENGVSETLKALRIALRTNTNVVEGVLNNTFLISLGEELKRVGVSKYDDELLALSNVIAQASRKSTRMGQENQILSQLDRDNPIYILGRLHKAIEAMADVGAASGGAAKAGSREAVEKELRKAVDSVDIKKTLTKELDANICKV
jgi:hypothetical protein